MKEADKAISAPTSKKPRVFYGYVIVIVAFFVMVTTSGTLYSFGVFVKPLIDEFGWSRAEIAGVYSAALFVLGILFTITGRLNDRFGPRRILTVCGLVLGLGFIVGSRVENVWQLYLVYGGMIAIGQSGSLIPMTSTIARWFIKKRGLMTGIVIAGAGAGQVIVPPIATQLIGAYGWRDTYIIMGIFSLVLLVVLAQFLKRDPGQIGQLPDGAGKIKQETMVFEAKGLSQKEALGTKQFWVLFSVYLCYGYMVQGTMVHLVPYATDLGISAAAAASILSVIGGVTIVGRIGTGSLGDRIGHKKEMISVFIVAIGAFIFLQFANELWMLILFAALFGFGYGSLIALESPMVAELFGLKAHGALLGIIHFGVTIGGATSPLVAGRIFDTTGSYKTAFLIVTGFVIAGLILATFLRPPKEFNRQGY